jgi:hypothetical protein
MVADIGVCDYLGDILASLESNAFQRCFVAWVASVTGSCLRRCLRIGTCHLHDIINADCNGPADRP